MGNTTYSTANASTSRTTKGAFTNTVSENFKQRAVHRDMDAVDITLREARDSPEHPDSLAIILGLDVTGSMGSVPQRLCRDGLPKIMGKIIQRGTPDPALLFLGIGDHECDRKPLQVGQFESGDEELDHWLESTWLEGGGGGNYGESYLLAWYFAARYTAIDCFENRDRKGLLITIGDEPPLRDLPISAQRQIMGAGQYSDVTATGILSEARRMYDVHHIHLGHHGSLSGRTGNNDWEQLLGSNVHTAQTEDLIPDIVIDIVTNHPDGMTSAGAPVVNTPDSQSDEVVL